VLHTLPIVGAMMVRSVTKIDWQDHTEPVPVFLTMIGIPLSYSIADSLALRFSTCPVIKLFSRRGREVVWSTYLLAAILVLYFVFVRSRMGAISSGVNYAAFTA
jgi:adenine/guanine/hypoxanthine permease